MDPTINNSGKRDPKEMDVFNSAADHLIDSSRPQRLSQLQQENTSNNRPSEPESKFGKHGILLTIAMTCYAFSFLMFRLIIQNYRVSIWEDIYWRNVFFFVCSVVYYIANRRLKVTIFDIPGHIRYVFFSRLVI